MRGLGAEFDIGEDRFEVVQHVRKRGLELRGSEVGRAGTAEENLVVSATDQVLGMRDTEEAGEQDSKPAHREV